MPPLPNSSLPPSRGEVRAFAAWPLISANSSLPPSRGEVRWGVEGNERPPAVASRSNRPLTPLPAPAAPLSPLPLLCHPCRSSVTYTALRHLYRTSVTSTAPPSFLRPQPSFLRRQEPTQQARLVLPERLMAARSGLGGAVHTGDRGLPGFLPAQERRKCEQALALAAGAERLGAEGVVASLEEGVEAALAAGGVEVRYIGAVGRRFDQR